MINMNIVKWIPQILLAAAFLMAGLMKMFTPYEEIVATMAWTKDVSPILIKILGLLEFLGALGLILPMALKKWPILVPIAAICLGLIMIPAMFIHLNLGEPIWANIVLLGIAIVVVWIRRDLFKVA